jgi:hypothetical protein
MIPVQADRIATRLARSALALMLVSAATSAYWAVRAPCPRAVRRLAWLEAAILTVYGGVLTGTGLVVQAGLVGVGSDADWKALDWHVYLWDPWFVVVGLLVWVALHRTRSLRPGGMSADTAHRRRPWAPASRRPRRPTGAPG